jgi:nucleoside-diphosphate-sugar epimerase
VSSCTLVTGAQGFVGRYLVATLLASDPAGRIIGVGRSQRCDNFTHTVTSQGVRVPAPVPREIRDATSGARYTYVKADVRDRRAMRSILGECQPEVIFHLASGLRDDTPQHLFGANVEGTIELLESVHEIGLDPRAIVIGSSGSVYGLPAHLPVTEDSPCEPRDFYAVSKLAQEQVSRILARERHLPLILARIFNIVGPGQDERHVAGRFASQIAAIVAGTSEPRLQVGDVSPTRDFIDVRDVARALIVLAKRENAERTYNIASGIETPISKVLKVLIQAAGLPGAVELDIAYIRASDTPRVVADIGELRSTGYEPAMTLEKSLSDVLAYYSRALSSKPDL